MKCNEFFAKDTVFCSLMVFIWGGIAHGIAFISNSVSHDSLNEFDANHFGNEWKIELGRIFVPIYRALTRDMVTISWLIGFLALFFISATLILLVRMFKIESRIQICLIAGILTVNITIIAQCATYINDLDCNMLALLMATLAVYFWKKNRWGFIWGMIPIAISIGLYQSYISVAVMLILMNCVLDLLSDNEHMQVIKNGIRSLVMLAGGSSIYLLITKIVLLTSKISLATGKYNSLDNVFQQSLASLPNLVKREYVQTLYELINVPSVYSSRVIVLISISLFLIIGILIIHHFFSNHINLKKQILVIVLLFIMPIGMNISYILTGGMSHDLMHYSLWLAYLFIILLMNTLDFFSGKKTTEQIKSLSKLVFFGMIFILLWGNVQLANEAYLKKNIEREKSVVYFNQVIDTLKNEFEYEGTKAVMFVGTPKYLKQQLPGFEKAYQITGSDNPYILGGTSYNRCYAFFNYILPYDLKLLDQKQWEELEKSDDISNMPDYPESGGIKELEDVIVVKLGEVED